MGPRSLLLLAALLVAPAAGRGEAPNPRSAPLRVVVCDSHHHVLRHWLEAAEQGLLPASGVEVVHFDAHPDLAVPVRVPRVDLRARPGALVAGLDIATFQLAAVWVGLVDRVVWLRPAFAHQLPDGTRQLSLGLDRLGRLRVDDPADYWVVDDRWAPTRALREPRRLEVTTLALGEVGERPLHRGAAILDVDLDGFATRNPGADRLRAAGLLADEIGRLRRAFAPERLRLPEEPALRGAALAEILGDVAAATGDELAAALPAALRLWRRGVSASDLVFAWRLARAASLPGEALRDAGLDLVGLPESLEADVDATARALAALLARGLVAPDLVTVARSVRDGYTPREVWPDAERALLRALREVRALDVRYDRGLRPVAAP